MKLGEMTEGSRAVVDMHRDGTRLKVCDIVRVVDESTVQISLGVQDIPYDTVFIDVTNNGDLHTYRYLANVVPLEDSVMLVSAENVNWPNIRQEKRIKFVTACSVYKDKQPVLGMTKFNDISLSGCGISYEGRGKIKEGDALSINFKMPDGTRATLEVSVKHFDESRKVMGCSIRSGIKYTEKLIKKGK